MEKQDNVVYLLTTNYKRGHEVMEEQDNSLYSIAHEHK